MTYSTHRTYYRLDDICRTDYTPRGHYGSASYSLAAFMFAAGMVVAVWLQGVV